jgi:hypothetical protein
VEGKEGKRRKGEKGIEYEREKEVKRQERKRRTFSVVGQEQFAHKLAQSGTH